MCIICDKPAGVDMPSDEEIKYLFQGNPDGAGVAIQGWFEGKDERTGQISRNFEVHYVKGLMRIKDLLAVIKNREELKPYRVVIHCRIKTSGPTDQGTTHPFPLTSNFDEMRKLRGEGAVLFHNGIFQGLGGGINENSSDTQDFVAGIANKMLKRPGHTTKLADTIARAVAGDCRVLILYPNPFNPEFKLGKWIEHNGVYYSNERILGRAQTSYTSYPYYDKYEYTPTDEDVKDYLDKYAGKTISSSSKFDEFGANISDTAIPSEGVHWIICKDKERFNEVLSRAKAVMTDQTGTKTYEFYFPKNKEWKVDEKALWIYDKFGEKLIEYRQAIEDELFDDLIDDNVIQFYTYEEMQEFSDENTHLPDGAIEHLKKKWYLDWGEMTAYTEEGLKMLYPSGQYKHIMRSIAKNGYDKYSLSQKGESNETRVDTSGETTRTTEDAEVHGADRGQKVQSESIHQ